MRTTKMFSRDNKEFDYYLIPNYISFSSNIPNGQCAWIGASTWNVPEYQFRWLQVPPSYNTAWTRGKSLRTTFNNFTSGNKLTQEYLIKFVL